MHWTAFIAVVVATGIITSLTDWLFAGDWVHRLGTYPEVWRPGSESRAIALTSPLPFLTCAVFAYLLVRLDPYSVTSMVKLAIAVWVIGPLPLILTNAAFIKLHRLFVTSYAVGWLVKLLIVAVAAGLFLR